MIKDKRQFWGKIVLSLLLAIALFGFFYFEPSLILRIVATVLGVGSLVWTFWPKIIPGSSNINRREILILFILYLSLSSVYNLLYSLGIPLAIIMIVVCLLVFALFFGLLALEQLDELFGGPRSWVFIILAGLVLLEVFLSLAFWPVDPKFKSLILVVVFYAITNLIYLYAQNMLRLKRVIGFMVVSIFVLAIVILTIFMGNRIG